MMPLMQHRLQAYVWHGMRAVGGVVICLHTSLYCIVQVRVAPPLNEVVHCLI